MKKLLAVLALTASLAACAQTPTIDREAIFLELVHSNTDNTSTDAQLITLARASCDAMESGATIQEIAYVVAGSGLDRTKQSEVSKIIGYGISQYCPEYAK